MRITPYYESKGIKNPYYVLAPTVVNGVIRELKKKEAYKKITSNDLLFRNVEPNQLTGSIIYRATSLPVKFFRLQINKRKIFLMVLQPQLKRFMLQVIMEWYLERMPLLPLM